MQPRPRVLVVDDEPSICKALSIALERAGYDASIALSGDAALEILAREQIDVMLLDLRIPDTRGDILFELAAATQPQLRRQTIFMTGDISEQASKLVAACNCPCIAKPFALRTIVAAVARTLPRRNGEQSA